MMMMITTLLYHYSSSYCNIINNIIIMKIYNDRYFLRIIYYVCKNFLILSLFLCNTCFKSLLSLYIYMKVFFSSLMNMRSS